MPITDNTELRKLNHEGYLDLTAYHGIKNAESKSTKWDSRFKIKQAIRAIEFTAQKFGFSVTKVELYDKHTGKTYKE